MRKPLLRWTIGPVHPLGFKILKHSVHTFKKIYKNEFDYIICHNQLTNQQKEIINTINIPNYEQFHSQEMEFKPHDVAWKLYPPRLAQDRHEVWIDNDVVIYDRIKELDKFLTEINSTFATTGLKRNFGRYDSNVPENLKLNSGFFGLPPNFDLSQKIKEIQKNDHKRFWSNRYDEQGLVAFIITEFPKYYMIPLETISISLHKFVPASKGSHFAGINQGHAIPWNEYYVKHLHNLFAGSP